MAALAYDLDALAEDVAEVVADLGSFGELLEIRTKDAGKSSFGWDAWHPEQRRFERTRTGRDLVLKPRQIGFTTLELARDFQFARTHEGAQVVVVVHTGEAKTELFAAVHLMERSLRRWGLVPAAKENTKTGLRWDDVDSSIKVMEAGKDEHTAAARGRSGTIHRLHVTEAAFYQSPEETMTALLAAAGDNEVVIESTANGVGNWFHQHVLKAREGRFDDFRFHFFPWYDHPTYSADPRVYGEPGQTKRERFWEEKLRELGLSAEQLAWWRRTVQRFGLDKALREYPPTAEAAFTESGESWIAPEYVDRLRAATCEPIEHRELSRGERKFPPMRVYAHPEQGKHYIEAVDPSEGIGINEAAITVIEHRSAEVVATWHDDRTKPGELAHVAAAIGRYYRNALVAVERNAWRRGRDGQDDREGGLETLRVLERDEHYPRIYREKNDKLGWSTNGETRPLIFGDLIKAIEDGEVTNPDARAVDEAASIKIIKGRPDVPRKDKGRGDDGLFITWGIARQVRERAPMPGRINAAPVGKQLTSANFRT